MSGYSSSTSMNPLSLKRVNTSLNFKALTSRLGLSEEEKIERNETVNLEGEGYSITFEIPNKNEGWRVDKEYEDVEAFYNALSVTSTKVTDIVGAGLPTRKTDIDMKEFDNLMKAEIGIQFTSNIGAYNPLIAANNRDKAIKRAIEMHKEKIIDDMGRKYKTMMKKGVFDAETNKIRIQNIARCSFSKFDPSKVRDILMEDKNFDKKLLNNQHLKTRSGPPGNITPRQKSMPGKQEFQYGFLSGLYSTNDDEKPQNPNSVLTKVPAASEKKVFKSFEETNQTKFLDKILSYNMTPATALSRNPFLSEEVKMVMDRDLGEVGANGPRLHKEKAKQEKPGVAPPKAKPKEEAGLLREKQKQILEARKRKLSEASKQTEADQINTTATKIKELTKYDPANCGEKTLTEIMPSLDYSVSQMLEKILEEDERQEEEDILCYMNVKPAFATAGTLKDNTLDAFLYGKLDTSRTDPEAYAQREQFMSQEFKEFNPKEIEKQKQNLTQANIKNTKLTMETLQRYKEEKNQDQFQQLFSAKQKVMKDEGWQERDNSITETCQSLETLIVDMCNEMKKMNENKLISAVTPRYSVLDDMATAMVTILKCIPFDWNPRTKREWSQGAEVLLMWSMKLSSTLNINRHEHIIKLAKFYVNIFFENEILMNNLFEHYKEVVIDEIKKPKAIINEDDEEEELKLPKINTFSEWKNPEEDEDEDDSDSGGRISPAVLSHNLELKRRRVSRIKNVLFIIINYINHCNTYTQDVFKQIVQKEKQKFQFEKAVKEKSLKETGKQELVQSFLEKRGLVDITNYIKNTDWSHDTTEENLPRDHIDTEVRKEKEIDVFANMFKSQNESSKSNLKGTKHNKSTPRLPTDLPTSRSNKPKEQGLKKTLVVGDIPDKPPLEYQRSYYIEPPKGIPYFPTRSKNEPALPSKTNIDVHPIDIMASENSLMFTGSDHSDEEYDNERVSKNKQTSSDDSILDKISDIEHKSISRHGSTFSEDAVMHEEISNEDDQDLEVKEDHEPSPPTPKAQYHPEEVHVGTPHSDAVSLHSLHSESSGISTKSNDHDTHKIKKPTSKKRTTPDVTSIHEKKSKNLRRYTLQKRSTSSASATTNSSQNSRNASRASDRNDTPPIVPEPKKSASPVKLTAKNLELSNQLNNSMTTPLSEADTNSDILRVSIRSSTSIILKDDSPRSTKTPRSRRSLPSSEKKNPHSGKWAIKTSIFQNMFDNSTLFTGGDDSPRRLDNNVDRFDSVTLLEKLEQVWDDLLIPAGFKIKLYQKYGSSKYIGNVNLMKDAYKTWKQGATVVAARETVLIELKEFENTLTSNMQKLTTFSDKVQEQKLRSTLFKRLSILGTECEKLNRKLKKDHNDNLSYNSEMPYIEKMKYDYLSIIAGIESLTEQNQPIDVNTSMERLRSPNKKTADVTKVDLILSYEK